MDQLVAALTSELIEREENCNALWIKIRRRYSERSGNLSPKAPWAFVALLCVLLLLAPHSAAAQSPGSWPTPAPTAEDIDPGVDHTANTDELPAALRRTSIFYRTQYPIGTIIVNTADRFLYLITGHNTALRYGIGVGRDGFQWGGIHRITRKAQWPDWTPPPEMIARQPYLPRFMAGGPGNPLGARALYIGTTVYRIHGTNAPETIGQAVSSGCFRLVNEDIMDLYDRVPVGTMVVVQHL
jgi:lipoprotein-anchoring transpeptidase ErfK/SrfK